MRNLWLLLLPALFVYTGGIGTIIYEIVKRPRYHRLKIVFLVGVLMLYAILDIPLYKDIAKQETQIVIAEYVKFQSSNTLPGTRKVFFENEQGQLGLYVPTITRDVGKLQEGKTYEIEYFTNRKVIKTYKLLE